ncbi:MAG TPA: right-handed parallel beta-helix repeat-containing protein, partial [Planctomycetota bacterium]|nr:right-handed parallel beta-helix repeat-containing protein [Planctomycetota bacterium]
PPGSLAAIPGNQAATLAWTPSPSPDTAFYRLWWKAAAANWTAATLLDNLAGTSTTVTGLVNGSLYDFRLRAVDAAGNESTDLFASATPQPSIQIQGGGSFSTIQQAIDAAAPGQVVIVGPGTYGGDIVLHPGVSLEGYSPNYTILQGSGLGPVITVEGSFGSGQSSTISQLTVTGGLTGISTTSADLTVRNGVIHHVAGDGIQAGVASRLTAINVTTVSNTGDGIEAAGTTIIRNTLAGENGGTGFNVPLGASLSYNDAWGNTVDYTVGAGVSGNLSVAAVFTNEAAHDYTTPASSPTVDVGDPADDFSNEPLPNGGRIDQGAYGNTAFAPLTTNPPAATTSTAPGRRRGGGCGLLGLEALLLFILRRRRARAARPRTF